MLSLKGNETFIKLFYIFYYMINGNSVDNAVAAFIVAFFLLVASASAATYDECPYSTKVENSWWDANECEGGIYGYGALYLKWSDAPFTNETDEVESVTLIVSAVSQGTDFVILMWNGYSWSALNGGRLDFRGDYVYDLHNLPGPYMDGSMRIKILNRGAETLHVSDVRVVVEFESKIREFTVTVKDCETKKRIDGVEVEADGTIVETDDDGVAVLHLSKEKVYDVRIGGDDYNEISRRVYIYDDDDAEVCVYFQKDYAVDVYDLDVEDGIIEFTVENTGNVDDADVRYWVFVNDDTIFDGYMNLDVGEDDDVRGSYNFPPGRHKVRARAQSGSYADSETVTYCVEGVTENYMCSNGNVAVEIIKDNCVSQWKVVEYCDEDCVDGHCAADGEITDADSGVCDADITSVTYTDGVPANRYVNAEASVTNTGNSGRDITVRAYVDGKLKDREDVYVKKDETVKVNLRFKTTQGTHTLRIDASACGSVRDGTTYEIKVNKAITQTAGVPEGRDVEESPEIEEVKNIYIETSQKKLFSVQCEGVVLKASVYPPTETYRVSVTGVSQEWLYYTNVLNAVEKNDFYVYVTPKEAGNYTLKVRVFTIDGEVSAVKEVKLYATPRMSTVSADSSGDSPGAGNDTDADALTGMSTLTQSPLLGFMIIGVLIVVVLLLIFSRQYMVNTHDYDSNWGTSPVNYDDEVRKAAIDDFSSF